MRTFFKLLFSLEFVLIIGYCALVGLVYYWEITLPAPSEYDSIIVLGAQVLPSGEPSVQLQNRLNVALSYYKDKPCPVVCCGAQGENEPRPEGEVMRDVLISGGVEENLVYSDSVSINTRQNIANAKQILEELGCKKPLIVTSDYHVKRALALAKDMGMDAEGAGSPCRSEIGFWLKNHCREALSWIKYWGEKCLGIQL